MRLRVEVQTVTSEHDRTFGVCNVPDTRSQAQLMLTKEDRSTTVATFKPRRNSSSFVPYTREPEMRPFRHSRVTSSWTRQHESRSWITGQGRGSKTPASTAIQPSDSRIRTSTITPVKLRFARRNPCLEVSRTCESTQSSRACLGAGIRNLMQPPASFRSRLTFGQQRRANHFILE